MATPIGWARVVVGPTIVRSGATLPLAVRLKTVTELAWRLATASSSLTVSIAIFSGRLSPVAAPTIWRSGGSPVAVRAKTETELPASFVTKISSA